MSMQSTPLTEDLDPTAVLLVSGDESLVGDVRRLAAAAGVEVAATARPAAALSVWGVAPLVLLGTDRAAEVAALQPPRRGQVHVLGRGDVPHDAFRDAVRVGAESVAELPASEAWLVEVLTDAGDGGRSTGLTVGVVGGAGGVGATVFAAALARTASRQLSTLLVDTDPLGAGIERVLGLERARGVRWDAMVATTGRLGARALRESLPRADDLAVLAFPGRRTGPPPPFAVREVLSAARRGFDLVVLDLPRHGDAAVVEAMSRCDRLVLVSGLTVPAVTAASRVVGTLPDAVPTGLVTRGTAGSLAPEEVARFLRLRLIAAMSDQRGLDEALDLGAGPVRSGRGPLARAARACLADLGSARAAA
jgi:secretion/DNA translocation related CpaE-like protein